MRKQLKFSIGSRNRGKAELRAGVSGCDNKTEATLDCDGSGTKLDYAEAKRAVCRTFR